MRLLPALLAPSTAAHLHHNASLPLATGISLMLDAQRFQGHGMRTSQNLRIASRSILLLMEALQDLCYLSANLQILLPGQIPG